MHTKVPRAFISYSWDTEEHKGWVRELATRLRQDGVDVMLDQWGVAPGDQLPEFMEHSLREHDFILIVCTPQYKRKSDERVGGVGYEGHIMTAELFTVRNNRKFIPILRHSSWEDAAPSWLLGKYYIDLYRTDRFEADYQKLLATLHGRGLQAPPIGGGEAYPPNLFVRSNIPSVKGFVGRENDLKILREEKSRGKTSIVLHGQGGVGKTALALRFIEEIRDEFQMHIRVDMQGLSNNALSPTDAMLEVVRRFEPTVPTNLEEKEINALFTSCLSQPNIKTMLFLDNARDREQVEPLNQRPAFVVITSRAVFNVAEGFSKSVEQMSPGDARDLLFSIAAEKRFEGQADKLAELAGYLPMALKPLAALLAEDELETVTALIEKYRNKKKLLKESVPDYKLTIEASFDMSYQVLSSVLQERWRRLSVFPSDFDEAAMAFVLDISEGEAEETQKRLRKLSLLEVNLETRRFNLHDLAREFADSKLDEFTKPDEIKEMPFWRRFRVSTALRFLPSLSSIERSNTKLLHAKYYLLVLKRAGVIRHSAEGETDFYDALNLIDTEWNNITTGQRWTAEFAENDIEAANLCYNYAVVFAEFLALRLHPREFLEWQKAALKLFQKFGRNEYIRQTLLNLGIAYGMLGGYREAIGYCEQALQIARQVGDRDVENICLGSLGNMHTDLHEYRQALEYYRQAKQIAAELGDIEGEATWLGNMGNIHMHFALQLSNLEFSNSSESVYQDVHKEYQKLYVEELMLAGKCITSALAIHERTGNVQLQAGCLSNLGNCYIHIGDYQQAIQYFEEALRLSQSIDDKEGSLLCLAGLGKCQSLLDRYEAAIEYLEQALQIAQAIGNRAAAGKCLFDRGFIYLSAGEKEKACESWREASEILEMIESPNVSIVQEILRENCAAG